MNPEVKCHIHKGSPIVSILSRIDPIPRIDTYFLRSILILSPHLRLGLLRYLFRVTLFVKILKSLLSSSILATCSAHLHNLLNLIPDYIRRTVYTTKFLIVEPFPLPILIPLWPKYSLMNMSKE